MQFEHDAPPGGNARAWPAMSHKVPRLGLCLLALFCCVSLTSCDPINIYMVAHSHCDVGFVRVVPRLFLFSCSTLLCGRSWLLTPDEYFNYEVIHILDTAMATLDEDASALLRYHWVEVKWLPMWLAAGDGEAKLAKLQRLVNSGRLEILGGALHVVFVGIVVPIVTV